MSDDIQNIPIADVPEKLGDLLCTAAKDGLVEVDGTYYSSYNLLDTLDKNPYRFVAWDRTGDIAGGAAAGVTVGGGLAPFTLGLSIIAPLILGAIFSKQHFAMIMIINKRDEDLVLGDTGSKHQDNPYNAHGKQTARPIFEEKDLSTGSVLSTRTNVIPKRRVGADGAVTYGLGFYMFANNDFIGISARGTEGTLVLKGADGGMKGDLALSWSSPWKGMPHVACKLNYLKHYKDADDFWDLTTDDGKDKKSDSSGGVKVHMSVHDREYENTIKVPCVTWTDVVYTVCVE